MAQAAETPRDPASFLDSAHCRKFAGDAIELSAMQTRLPLIVRTLLRFGLPLLLGLWIYHYFANPEQKPAAPTELRLPATNPPIEPDRPDLLEEPRIEPDNT